MLTVKNFGRYISLVELLGSAFAGDKVTADILDDADVIAFEQNDDSPAPSDGWESCEWRFSDAQDSLIVKWDAATVKGTPGGTPVPRDPHVVANGSITGDKFCAAFNVPEQQLLAANPSLNSVEKAVVSFLLFRVRPEINVHSDSFEVTINLTVTSPDVDAIGVLVHGNPPEADDMEVPS